MVTTLQTRSAFHYIVTEHRDALEAAIRSAVAEAAAKMGDDAKQLFAKYNLQTSRQSKAA